MKTNPLSYGQHWEAGRELIQVVGQNLIASLLDPFIYFFFIPICFLFLHRRLLHFYCFGLDGGDQSIDSN
ncbi:hypothetical protein L2E82_35693 [Cichorium intybus]|uniref:Uncharacterized protein n=1 Tax=Cichorium intybus TaxID=13427 RepID=A0ACB9BPG9_CICIN|nr:hypothetical protein L2E82_35693 [Cichorium intybus]